MEKTVADLIADILEYCEDRVQETIEIEETTKEVVKVLKRIKAIAEFGIEKSELVETYSNFPYGELDHLTRVTLEAIPGGWGGSGLSRWECEEELCLLGFCVSVGTPMTPAIWVGIRKKRGEK